MGLLKKIFKPISKVLDKIIPNEIKPALPYLAAFAPYMGGMQGIMGQWYDAKSFNVWWFKYWCTTMHKKVAKVISIYYQRDSERCKEQ